jgi:thiol-disulfide isomerase/thioredoxin
MIVKSFRILVFLLLVAPLSAPAIDMPLTDMYGNVANLNGYRGKWVVVNYWATWCPPCISEMPELQNFHDAHADKDAVVIGINTEHISRQRLETFLEDYFITYPIFVSPPIQESELGLIPGLPTTFMVSPEGEVVARQVGPVSREILDEFLRRQQAD